MKDRIAEYVDSPYMRLRLRDGGTIVAFIRGSLGIYRVEAQTVSGRGTCTCPSEWVPCKHVYAVLETFKRNPNSFQDTGALLEAVFEGKDRDEVLAALRIAVLQSPRALAALDLIEWEDDVEDEW